MTDHFDLIVLGSGSAGQTPAYGVAKAGWSVAMIDPREPGGTCANRGCDAKKPLVNAAAAVEAARRLTGHGIAATASIHWPDLIRFKRSFTADIPDRTRRDLRNAGITLIAGSPRFTARDAIDIDGRTLTADRFLIATGLKPRPLDMPGGDLAVTSDDFLELDDLPPRLIFIGGGFISFEFAHAAARAGVHCTILEQNPRPLKAFDADLVAQLVRASEAAGIRVVCDSCVTRLERDGDRLIACCEHSGTTYEADLLVHGAGRVPSLDTLDLDAAGITHGPHGVTVDQHLRSQSNSAIWAVGDCAATDQPQLTPVAGADARLVLHNLLHPDKPRKRDPRPVPSVVFTDPPLASVGPTEQQAREQGLDVQVSGGDASPWKVYRQLGVEHAAYKTLIDRKTGRLIAAHLLGPGAEETINVLALAVREGLSPDVLSSTPWTYPTVTSLLPYMLK